MKIKFESPKLFADILGNETAKATLTKYAAKGVPGRFLIIGEPDTGKSALATVTARRYACDGNPQDVEPCGSCSACSNGIVNDFQSALESYDCSDPDIRRTMFKDLKHSLSIGSVTAYVIDDVDKCKQESLVPLLDGAPDTTFILTTSKPVEKLDDRLVARCVQVEAMKLSDEDAQTLATRLAEAVGVTLSPEEVATVVSSAGGSGRRITIEIQGVLLSTAP